MSGWLVADTVPSSIGRELSLTPTYSSTHADVSDGQDQAMQCSTDGAVLQQNNFLQRHSRDDSQGRSRTAHTHEGLGLC